VSRRPSPRTFGILGVALAALLLPACARNPKPVSATLVGPTVKVWVKKSGSERYLRVSEIGFGVCKNDQRCGSSFSFKFQSGSIADTDRIEITTAGGSDACLTPKPPYRLTEADPEVTVSFNDVPACLDVKDYWLYKVACVDQGGGDCGGIEPEDPGVIIDGGPRS